MSDCLCKHSFKMSTARYWNQTKKICLALFLMAYEVIWRRRRVTPLAAKFLWVPPLGAGWWSAMAYIHVLGLQAPLCPAAHAPAVLCSTLSVVSPLFLLYSGFAFLHQAVFVNKNPGSGGQELDWRDAAFPDQDMVKFTRYRTFPPFALPGRQFPGGCCPEMHHLVPFEMG